MKTKRFGWALVIAGVAWLGVAIEARAGDGGCIGFEVCPDDVRVCVSESGEASIQDQLSKCTYHGTGKIKPNEKKGFVKVKAKGENDSYGCGEKAKVSVKYDPETGQCIKKAKVKVGDEKREVETPTWCSCEDLVGFCGDGSCGPGEDSESCPEDCPTGSSCAELGCGNGSDDTCFCDDLCVDLDDCCPDACSLCGQCE